MSTGTPMMREILKAIGSLRSADGWTRMFRCNRGMAWAGKAMRRHGTPHVLVQNARPLHAGLVNGNTDTIGWTSRIIRPEDVGRRVAIFTAIEVKTGAGALEADQVNFIKQVQDAGGIAGEARNVDEALAIISRWDDIR